jgi:hypothetical protein
MLTMRQRLCLVVSTLWNDFCCSGGRELSESSTEWGSGNTSASEVGSQITIGVIAFFCDVIIFSCRS